MGERVVLQGGAGNQGIRDRCIVLLLYYTGIRAGELAALRVSDITLVMLALACLTSIVLAVPQAASSPGTSTARCMIAPVPSTLGLTPTLPLLRLQEIAAAVHARLTAH